MKNNGRFGQDFIETAWRLEKKPICRRGNNIKVNVKEK
jgi:hypothetical protein